MESGYYVFATGPNVKRLQDERQTQTTLIEQPDIDDGGFPTLEPTLNNNVRPTMVVVCQTVIDPTWNTLTTNVEFVYTVELNVSHESLGDQDVLTFDIPKWVSGSMVDSVADDLCTDHGEEQMAMMADNNDRSLSVAPCILSVTSSSDDEVIPASCEPSYAESLSCVRYSGSLRVVHTDECMEEEIKEAVLGHLTSAATTEAYVADINSRDSLPGFDVTHLEVQEITAPSPTPPAGVIGAGAVITTSEGMTTGGAITVALMVILVVLLIILLWLWWCRRRAAQRLRELNSEEKSHSTDSSQSDEAPSEEASCDEQDVQSLSTVDVHRCNSALCPVCRPNLGKVNMIPVVKESPLPSLDGGLFQYFSRSPSHQVSRQPSEVSGSSSTSSGAVDDSDSPAEVEQREPTSLPGPPPQSKTHQDKDEPVTFVLKFTPNYGSDDSDGDDHCAQTVAL